MADDATATTSVVQCLECGFEAPVRSGEWDVVDLPGLGALTQCPECGSTNTSSR